MHDRALYALLASASAILVSLAGCDDGYESDSPQYFVCETDEDCPRTAPLCRTLRNLTVQPARFCTLPCTYDVQCENGGYALFRGACIGVTSDGDVDPASDITQCVPGPDSAGDCVPPKVRVTFEYDGGPLTVCIPF